MKRKIMTKLYRIIILSFIFIIFFSFTSTTLAAPDWPVTSPFGWRTHPIFGTQKFHNGIDFGVDEGTPIPCPAPGIITYSGWMSGYGYTVIVEHYNGSETLYAHQCQTNVITGQNVGAGQILGYVGSTGYSTGPHLHLGYKINGDWADPSPFLSACGWGISSGGGNGNSGVLDDLVNYEGFNEAPFDFDSYYNLGANLSDTLLTFVNTCKSGTISLQNTMLDLLIFLAIIDFTYSLYAGGFQLSWMDIIPRIFKYSTIIFLFVSWQDVVNNFFLSFFIDNASTFVGDSSLLSSSMSQPELLTQKGVFLMKPTFDYYASFSGLTFLGNLFSALIALFLGLAILLCFIIMSIIILIYYIEFYIMAMFSVFSIPFAANKFTKFVTEGGVGAFVSSGLKLMISSTLTGMIITIIKPLQPTSYELVAYIHIVFAVISFTLILLKVPKSLLSMLGGNVRF